MNRLPATVLPAAKAINAFVEVPVFISTGSVKYAKEHLDVCGGGKASKAQNLGIILKNRLIILYRTIY